METRSIRMHEGIKSEKVPCLPLDTMMTVLEALQRLRKYIYIYTIVKQDSLKYYLSVVWPSSPCCCSTDGHHRQSDRPNDSRRLQPWIRPRTSSQVGHQPSAVRAQLPPSTRVQPPPVGCDHWPVNTKQRTDYCFFGGISFFATFTFLFCEDFYFLNQY